MNTLDISSQSFNVAVDAQHVCSVYQQPRRVDTSTDRIDINMSQLDVSTQSTELTVKDADSASSPHQ